MLIYKQNKHRASAHCFLKNSRNKTISFLQKERYKNKGSMIYVNSMLIILGILAVICFMIEKNKYSLTLLFIFGGLILIGGHLLLTEHWWGLFFFAVGGIFLGLGIKGPRVDDEKPIPKVWLVTFRGAYTDILVKRLSLFFEALFDIIGHVEVELKKEDYDFILKKPIKCMDDKYVYVTVSTAMMPDDEDDSEETRGTSDWQSKAQKLQDFISIGQFAGAKSILDDMFTAGSQEIARSRTAYEMETEVDEISEELLNMLKNGELKGRHQSGKISNTSGLGLRFPKFIVTSVPHQDIINATNSNQVALEKRKTEKTITDTNNQQIGSRLAAAKAAGQNISFNEARQQVFEEELKEQGQYRVNKGGINVTNDNAQDNKKGDGSK